MEAVSRRVGLPVGVSLLGRIMLACWRNGRTVVCTQQGVMVRVDGKEASVAEKRYGLMICL